MQFILYYINWLRNKSFFADVVDLIPPIPGMKRGRGRPRKIPLVPLYAPDNTTGSYKITCSVCMHIKLNICIKLLLGLVLFVLLCLLLNYYLTEPIV